MERVKNPELYHYHNLLELAVVVCKTVRLNGVLKESKLKAHDHENPPPPPLAVLMDAQGRVIRSPQTIRDRSLYGRIMFWLGAVVAGPLGFLIRWAVRHG